MKHRLTLRNRQRTRGVALRYLRQMLQQALDDHCPGRPATLCFHLVTDAAMTRLNEQFLQHQGSTDVITFDYQAAGMSPADAGPGEGGWYGEIFICVDEAVRQARRFRTTWPCEIVRYALHGLLHLEGYDDRLPSARRAMKREENRRLRQVARRFALSRLAARRKVGA